MKGKKAAIRATPGPDFAQRVLTLAYRRLGRRYPAVFMAIELQTAWFITAGLLGLLSLYFDAPRSDLLLVLAISLALTGVTIAVALVRSVRYLRPLGEWIGSDRSDPEFAERAWSIAIGMPLYLLRRQMRLPIFCVAIPGSIAGVAILGLSVWAFFPILAASLIAIGYSGILHYFAVEAGLRPVVVDINRVVPPRLSTGHRAISLRLRLMAALPMITVITGLVALAISGNHGDGEVAGLGLDILTAIGVAVTIALELSILVSRSIIRPVSDLQKGIESVKRGNFDATVPVTTADELGELSAAYNQMVTGLAERERIREAFGTYLDEEVAEYILSDGYAPEGFEAQVSLLFCDVRDFTGFAADADAKQVVSAINELFETIVPIIAAEGGHVDKFIGDGLLAVFGAPQRTDDHAERAVRAAVEIARCVNHGEGVQLEVGVGVNSGTVIAGSIGGAGRLNFSVIGDAVNVASRVEAETRQTGDDVLITASTHAQLGERIKVSERGQRTLKGKSEPVELYAPLVGAEAVETPSTGTLTG
jgi:adenylate cyclase